MFLSFFPLTMGDKHVKTVNLAMNWQIPYKLSWHDRDIFVHTHDDDQWATNHKSTNRRNKYFWRIPGFGSLVWLYVGSCIFFFLFHSILQWWTAVWKVEDWLTPVLICESIGWGVRYALLRLMGRRIISLDQADDSRCCCCVVLGIPSSLSIPLG